MEGFGGTPAFPGAVGRGDGIKVGGRSMTNRVSGSCIAMAFLRSRGNGDGLAL